MLQELSMAAERLRSDGVPIIAKTLEGESSLSLFQINKFFRTRPKAVWAIGCKRQRVLPLRIFKRRMRKAARIIHKRGWLMTIPALAEVSGLNDKRIRSRLNAYPEFKAELQVVSSPITGCSAALERRR